MPTIGRALRIPRVRATRSRVVIGLCCAGLAGLTALGTADHPKPVKSSTASLTTTAARSAGQEHAASRDKTRTAAQPAAPAPATAPPAPPALPAIAGLTYPQVQNAAVIVNVGRIMGVGRRGEVIAIATALQESWLRNLNVAVDHDSLGLFQQRPSSGWGAPRELTNPWYAARRFYQSLVTYRGDWGCLTCAAQRVQVSAFPDAYAQHEAQANAIVTALGG